MTFPNLAQGVKDVTEAISNEETDGGTNEGQCEDLGDGTISNKQTDGGNAAEKIKESMTMSEQLYELGN